jgi:hypothetical protein
MKVISVNIGEPKTITCPGQQNKLNFMIVRMCTPINEYFVDFQQIPLISADFL